MEQALALYAKNGNTLWVDAISKGMEDVRVAFEALSDRKPVPKGHQFVQCHMVFDINIEDFRHKARLLVGGHMTKALSTITYASEVSRKTVRIALIIAAHNEVKSGNILNAYVWALVTEEV